MTDYAQRQAEVVRGREAVLFEVRDAARAFNGTLIDIAAPLPRVSFYIGTIQLHASVEWNWNDGVLNRKITDRNGRVLAQSIQRTWYALYVEAERLLNYK